MKCTGIKLNKTLHIKEKKILQQLQKKEKKRNKQLEEKIERNYETSKWYWTKLKQGIQKSEIAEYSVKIKEYFIEKPKERTQRMKSTKKWRFFCGNVGR